MSNKYFSLKTKDGLINKRFRVIEGGYGVLYQKGGGGRRTIEGGVDIHAGKVLDTYSFVVRLAHTEEDSNYGTLGDLVTLFKLDNPSDPDKPCILVYTDHYGNVSEAYLSEEMAVSALVTIIEGIYAYFLIQVMIVILP